MGKKTGRGKGKGKGTVTPIVPRTPSLMSGQDKCRARDGDSAGVAVVQNIILPAPAGAVSQHVVSAQAEDCFKKRKQIQAQVDEVVGQEVGPGELAGSSRTSVGEQVIHGEVMGATI